MNQKMNNTRCTMHLPEDLQEELQEDHDEMAYRELVSALLEEQDGLVDQIISLRMHINRLYMQLHYARHGHMQTPIPYPDPASDIVRDFSGFAAMQKWETSTD